MAAVALALTAMAGNSRLLACAASVETERAAARAETSALLTNIYFIGASATAGFGVVAPVENHSSSIVPVPLAATFAGAIRQSEPQSVGVHDLGSPFFFLTPGKSGQGQVDRALEGRPSLVVGVDFLFWYVYGTQSASGAWFKGEEERLANLEAGLAQLDRFDPALPIVVGDFPDMHRAVGKMISAAQMPKGQTLKAASARVREWAAKRGNAEVIPLAEIVEQLNGRQPVEAGGITFDPAKGKLIQSDELHPTLRGSVSMGLRIADAVNTQFLNGSRVPLAESEDQASEAAKEAAKRLIERRTGTGARATTPGEDGAKGIAPAPPVTSPAKEL